MSPAIKMHYLCTGRCDRTEFQLPCDKWEALLLQAHEIRQILTGPLSFSSGVRTAKLDPAGLDWASSLMAVFWILFTAIFQGSQTRPPLVWWLLLTSSGTQTQIISMISNDTWYRLAECSRKLGELWAWSGSPLLLNFYSRVCGWYSTEQPQTSLTNVHKPALQVKVILGASCP